LSYLGRHRAKLYKAKLYKIFKLIKETEMVMFNLLTPLKVLLNPPAQMQGLPGACVLLHVSLINQGPRGAVIDIFLDPSAQPLEQWCTSPRQQIALDPQQACEVSLAFEIPLGALPGIYPCTVVVDAPDHYPEETPLHYPCKLEVLAAEQPVERLETPTFSLSPVTSPNKPFLIEANKTHKLSITVHNHSTRVDRFRLACPDLDERWYTVQYLSTDLAEMGLVARADGLELNPGTQGEILMELHYPIDMPAGLYSPTIQLLSDNTLEQVYLDLVYLEVKPEYCLEADLETILGKARSGPGRYRLKLKNDSNLIRELAIGARGRDEVEWCRYDCKPDSVKMLIGETAEVSLSVHPLQKWRRPFIGFGRELPFQVDITDLQALPVPDPVPTGLFIWKARPWWHFILMLLAGLGVLSGIGLLIWFFFFKPSPPPALIDYNPDSSTYTEGDRIRLNWTIANADQLTQLMLTTSRNQTASTPQVYDLRKGIPSELSQYCQLRDRRLSCTNINTGARLAGKYNFQLKLTAKSAEQTIQKDLNVEIKPKPLPQVVKLGSRQSQLNKGQSLSLGWSVQNFSQLEQLVIVAQRKGQGGQTIQLKTYTFDKQLPATLAKYCQPPISETLTCSNVDIKPPRQPGDYEINLQTVSQNGQTQTPQTKPIQLKVKAAPLKILQFTLNGKSSVETPSVFLNVGQTIDLRWQVSGDNVKVRIEPLGDLPTSGAKTLKATTGLSQIVLTAQAEGEQFVKTAFLLQVDTPQSPKNPDNNLLLPLPNPPLFPKQ
jgi:hypothetical protein